VSGAKTYDVAVVGAGVFGAWTALWLARRGRSVVLLEAYGPGHSRSSSGDESRIIRMGYGVDEIYTRWSLRSLDLWRELFKAARTETLYHQTGVLWLGEPANQALRATREVLGRCGVEFSEPDLPWLGKEYPQINFEGIGSALYEPRSGVLLARRAVAATLEEAMRLGAEYRVAEVRAPSAGARLPQVKTGSGDAVSAGEFVFACGAWLGKMFPEILGERIFPTRQEVFYLGIPAGDQRFSPPRLPAFLFKTDESYGVPNLESRGLKIALDRHGERVDPDTQSRIVTPGEAEEIRKYAAYRFPALSQAPIVETRVCQYENTSSGDFLIDRHPEAANVWFVGGGSGHGFKHAPTVGEYLAGQILDGRRPEARFALKSKETVQKRSVY
jgi:monomeric sarcosine oxidase